jgi:hypothetical protein
LLRWCAGSESRTGTAAGIAEWFIGVEAAGTSLEDVAKPLTAHEEKAEAPA